MPVSIRPNSSAKMIQRVGDRHAGELQHHGMAIRTGGISAGQRGAFAGTGGTSALISRLPALTSAGCRLSAHRVGIDVLRLLDALDVRDVMVRQLAGARERPRDLQEAEAHQVGAERDAQVDDPLRHLEVGRHRVGVRDVPDEGRAERADDAGEHGAGEQAEQHVHLARAGGQPVDHHVDADVDAGAHAVGGAELRHPHEHVDAKLLRPREVDLEQRVLQARDRHAGRVAVDDRDEDQQRRRAHQERDQPLLEVIQELHAPPPGARRPCRRPALDVRRRTNAARRGGGPRRRQRRRSPSYGLKPVSL